MKKIYRLSLQRGLYLIITLCWILPLLLTVLWFAEGQEAATMERMEESISTSVNHAANEINRRLTDVMASSRAVSYDGDVAEYYAEYEKTEDYVTLYDKTSSYLQGKFAYNDAFAAAILLFWDNEELPVYISGYGLQNQSRIYRDFLTNPQSTLLEDATAMDTSLAFHQENGIVYVVRNLVDSGFRPYATLVLPLREEYLKESGANILWASDVNLYLDQVCIPITGAQKPLETYDLTYDNSQKQFTIGIKEDVDRHSFGLEVTVSDDFLRQQRETFYGAMIAIILVSGALFVLIMTFFYRNITTPIARLLHATSHLEKGDLGYQITQFPGNLEFYQLTNRFNHLSKRLVDLFDRNTMEQQALHDAQIKALQSQINPHFLNNTLEMINWQARMSGEEKVGQMIESLSIMLNAAIARGGSPMVTMREEFSYIEAYLFIISQRFGARLTVTQKIEEQAWEAMVPRLILQPIVENAVEHGVALRTSGEIHIHIYVKEGILYLDVNHAGTISQKDRETIDRLLSWDGQENMETGAARIGIRNVHLRLKILCGPDSGLKIWEMESGNVCNRMNMPFVPKKQPPIQPPEIPGL